MDSRVGDRVGVNLAPFIGSAMRSKESVACEILAIDGAHVEVCTLPPYKRVVLWVLADWIESELKAGELLVSS